MLQIDFASLANDRPDLSDVWRFMSEWIAKHPQVVSMELHRLVRAGKGISAGHLADALGVMSDQGIVKEVYRVLDHDGTVLEGEFSSLDEIPSRLPDSLHERYIETSETDVVPCYRLPTEATKE